MAVSLRPQIQRFVPGHFEDPFGLAFRLLRSGDRDAYGAMAQAALGAALSPLDRSMEAAERARYRAADPPSAPILLVCGPPRGGTTLLAQALIATLPVGYLSNLTGLFPRSPLTATARFQRSLPPWRPRFRSYFGRMHGLMAPNDGLQVWDRWLGPDRTVLRTALTSGEREGMRRFFGAAEALFRRPLVNKNNALNGQAALVGEVLPTARFLCLTRDPVSLAVGLLRARRVLHGDETRPYGLADAATREAPDPVESVCRQVRYLERLAEEQAARLGPERFRFVSYEAFCRDPAAVIGTVAESLGLPVEPARLAALPRFRVSAGENRDPAVRDRLAAILAASGPAQPA